MGVARYFTVDSGGPNLVGVARYFTVDSGGPNLQVLCSIIAHLLKQV